MLRIDIHVVHPTVTLRCSGKIVLGLEVETLRCMVMTRNEPCLSLDLSGISALDAAGLALLLELQCWANDNKKVLRIAEPSPCVRKLLDLTHLHFLLEAASCEQFDNLEPLDHDVSAIGAERAMSA
jgi:anti-anti-sigma factor